MLIEYEDVDERKRALARLKGVEARVYVEVEGGPRVYAIADEDLPRENDEKTAAVHFLRFELRRRWSLRSSTAPASASASPSRIRRGDYGSRRRDPRRAGGRPRVIPTA